MIDIRELRKKHRLTTDEFCRQIGLISETDGRPRLGQLSRWETGRNLPSRLWREKIEQAFGKRGAK